MSARADLCGGRSAMVVPTATDSDLVEAFTEHSPDSAGLRADYWVASLAGDCFLELRKIAQVLTVSVDLQR